MRNFTKILLTLALIVVCVGGTKAQDFYLDDPVNSLSQLSGKLFAITADNKAFYGSGDQNLGFDVYATALLSTNTAVCFRLVSLASNADETIRSYYMLRAVRPNGTDYGIWGCDAYLNSGYSNCFLLGIDGANKEQPGLNGQDIKNGAVWDIQYVENEGFKIMNIGQGGYLKKNTEKADATVPSYFNLCPISNIAPPTRTATDAKVISYNDFAKIGDAATWDADTKTLVTAGGFTWGNPGLDLSQYRYLVITAGNNRNAHNDGSDQSIQISIKDKSGTTVAGDDYGVSNQNLWFSYWNNLYCCKIDLEKLRIEKWLDIYHLAELKFVQPYSGTGNQLMLGTVYATNKEPITKNRWSQNDEGSFKITTGLTANKFGTICLPYQAAVSCAKIYEITSKSDNSIGLAEHEGLMEAGKPYFYKTTENMDPALEDQRVIFYQATEATVEDPVANNGLIGTFTGITCPTGDNILVLSNNQLWRVNSAVTVGANKAYVNTDAISTLARELDFEIGFADDGVTSVNEVRNLKNELSVDFFNLAGQRVAQPTKGLYIVNGKKVIIK